MDGDGDIDFAEWRKELKARGYSDLEIETVFAKYDQDGDKVTLGKYSAIQRNLDLEDEIQISLMIDTFLYG